MTTYLKTPKGLEHRLLAYYIYGILKLARSRKVLVSYVDLAHAFGIFSGGYDLARALGLVMEMVQGTDDDLLPVIVSKRRGTEALGPGEGFYEKAVFLGYEGTEDPEAFWMQAMKNLGYSIVDLTFITVAQDSLESSDLESDVA